MSVMIRTQLIDDMKMAMKAHQTELLGVLRFLISEIKNVEIDAKHELDDTEVVNLFRKEVKRRNDAIAQFKAAGRTDLVTQEETELGFINRYLPQLMDQTQITKIVDDVYAAATTKDFGSLMKAVMQQLKGQADGKLVSDLVRAKLSSN